MVVSIMRKVIDTNLLKSDKLREFLADPANVAVIPDYVVIETLAGRDPASICESFKILGEHPNQVVFLKPTFAISGLRARRRSRGLQKRLIDKKQTISFKKFYQGLQRAKDGDEAAKRQLASKCDGAIADLEALKKAQETYATNLAEHAKKKYAAELSILTKGKPVTKPLFENISGEVVGLADGMFEAHPYFKERPPIRKLFNAFIFRNAVGG